MRIDPDIYYRPSAPELRQLGAVQTLARWRNEARGPAYTRSASVVLYLGRDALDYLVSRRVETGDAA